MRVQVLVAGNLEMGSLGPEQSKLERSTSENGASGPSRLLGTTTRNAYVRHSHMPRFTQINLFS